VQAIVSSWGGECFTVPRLSRSKLRSVHRVDGELRAGGMANAAALSQRIGIRQEVRSFRFRNVASAASRGEGAGRRDPTLWIDHLIQVGQGQIVLLRTIDVAERAVLEIGCLAGGAHSRE